MALDFDNCSNEYLIETYVPDVYQESILSIDYDQLKNKGVKLISFDMDDTIAGFFASTLSRKVITLFESLKKKGFEVMIITNNKSKKVKRWAEQLDVERIEEANKPKVKCFEAAANMYKLKYNEEITPEQMAHVGNSIINDVGGAKVAGVYSCLVRDISYAVIIGKAIKPTTGHELREVLKERKIWRKHHKHEDGDQYYQLNEGPAHQKW